MYENYSAWESDIATRRKSSLGELDLNYKLGRGISAEGYAAGRARISKEFDDELRELRSGPTYQILQERWQASGYKGSFDEFYQGKAETPGGEMSVAARRGASPRRGLRRDRSQPPVMRANPNAGGNR